MVKLTEAEWLAVLEDNSIPEPNSGCWLWTGNVAGERKPYGAITRGGESHRAHRLSYTLHHGSITDGLWVLHKCDMPSCINPAHLFLGTSLDNVRDRNAKGRQAQGARQGAAKLTHEAVTIIRTCGRSIAALAVEFGVSDSAIYCAMYGLTWKSVPAVYHKRFSRPKKISTGGVNG